VRKLCPVIALKARKNLSGAAPPFGRYRERRNRAIQPRQLGKEAIMPEIYVHAVEGRSLDQKRALVQDITAAVVKNFNVSADAVMVQIVESAKENKAKGGVLFSERSQADRK
jgi:4-oxalocrotonate tautomerase